MKKLFKRRKAARAPRQSMYNLPADLERVKKGYSIIE